MKTKIIIAASFISLFLTSCGSDRGGVIVDASGEQGGGTQPGGGGYAFAVLFLVVALCALAMFTMDRIRKNKSRNDETEN
ncbi:MAG: hypothetical protein U0R17_03845 [Acidimicrobiia bacterium]